MTEKEEKLKAIIVGYLEKNWPGTDVVFYTIAGKNYLNLPSNFEDIAEAAVKDRENELFRNAALGKLKELIGGK